MLGSDLVLFKGFCVPFSNPRFATTVGAGVEVMVVAANDELPCPSEIPSSSSSKSSYAQAVTVDPDSVTVTSGSYIVV